MRKTGLEKWPSSSPSFSFFVSPHLSQSVLLMLAIRCWSACENAKHKENSFDYV